MHFDDFPHSFVTLFNMYCLDGWYQTMWNFIVSDGNIAALFFVLWIVLANWWLQGLLVAFIVREMEDKARDYILAQARGNKVLLTRVLTLRDRQMIKKAFKMYKRNTIETNDVKAKSAVEGKQQTNNIEELEEQAAEPSVLAKFFIDRKEYPMYIIRPGGKMQTTIKIIKNFPAFSLSVTICVVLAVTTIMIGASSNSSGRFFFSNSVWNLIDIIMFVVFMAEMIFAWACDGLFEPRRTAYFMQPMNFLEFMVNCFMVLTMFFIKDNNIDNVLNKFRIIRVAKMPAIVRGLIQSEALEILLESVQEGFQSIMSVAIVGGLLVYFFGIVCLALFVGEFGKCSYESVSQSVCPVMY